MESIKFIGLFQSFYKNNKSYFIQSKLGEGATCICFSCMDNYSNIYAIKLFKPNFSEEFQNENETLKKLKYEHIINLLEFGKGKIEINYSNKNYNYELDKFRNLNEINYSLFEICNYDLFEYIYVVKSGFNENIAKKIFIQILNSVEYIHKNNIVHCDIKPENILIDNNFKIKLIDFGYSVKLKNENEKLFKIKGTKIYTPPDCFYNNNKGFDGKSCDIFSLGVVLFVILMGIFPFKNALINDSYYKLIIKNDWKSFWKKINKNNKKISEEFRDLFQKMICFDSKKRIKINEIKEHVWLNGFFNNNNEEYFINEKDDEDYFNEFNQRKKIIDCKKKKDLSYSVI
jgi:serine/threonine protein kinase